jgi:hypothetical protein
VFSGSPVSSTNKTDHHDIAKILLTVALNTIKQTIPLTSTEKYLQYMLYMNLYTPKLMFKGR